MVLGFSEELNKHLLKVYTNSPSSSLCLSGQIAKNTSTKQLSVYLKLSLYLSLSLSLSHTLPPSLHQSTISLSLLQVYQENCQEVRAILSQMTLDLPHYHDLEWRLEVQLASRSLQQQALPSLSLRLHTRDSGTLHTLCLICTYGAWCDCMELSWCIYFVCLTNPSPQP